MYANLFESKIEMTKAEAKNAGKIGTDEYNTLMQLKKDFPGFPIEIVKTSTKKTSRFKGLDKDYMENYIKEHPLNIEVEMDEGKKESKSILEIFYELRGLDKDGKKIGMAAAASYGEIKMWFLTQYPEIEKMGEKVNKIIEETRKAREIMKAAN